MLSLMLSSLLPYHLRRHHHLLLLLLLSSIVVLDCHSYHYHYCHYYHHCYRHYHQYCYHHYQCKCYCHCHHRHNHHHIIIVTTTIIITAIIIIVTAIVTNRLPLISLSLSLLLTSPLSPMLLSPDKNILKLILMQYKIFKKFIWNQSYFKINL